jgi:hypothetical protein
MYVSAQSQQLSKPSQHIISTLRQNLFPLPVPTPSPPPLNLHFPNRPHQLLRSKLRRKQFPHLDRPPILLRHSRFHSPRMQRYRHRLFTGAIFEIQIECFGESVYACLGSAVGIPAAETVVGGGADEGRTSFPRWRGAGGRRRRPMRVRFSSWGGRDRNA